MERNRSDRVMTGWEYINHSNASVTEFGDCTHTKHPPTHTRKKKSKFTSYDDDETKVSRAHTAGMNFKRENSCIFAQCFPNSVKLVLGKKTEHVAFSTV